MVVLIFNLRFLGYGTFPFFCFCCLHSLVLLHAQQHACYQPVKQRSMELDNRATEQAAGDALAAAAALTAEAPFQLNEIAAAESGQLIACMSSFPPAPTLATRTNR